MITFVAETGSTNADLAERLSAGDLAPEGEWLVADRQSAGRGRQGRAWFDGSGNFMGSTVVRPRAGDPPLPTLALVAGVALHRVVAAALADPSAVLLKWPNDLMVGSAKLAGILLERAGDGVVVGMGINLVHAPAVDGRETTSLAALGGSTGRDAFAWALAAAFADDLAAWRAYGLGPLIGRWLRAAHPPGTRLLVGEPGEAPLAGEFAGLDGDGALILALADGTRQTIHAGEVRLGPAN